MCNYKEYIYLRFNKTLNRQTTVVINHMKEIIIGSAKSEPGKLTYGFIDSIDLPTMVNERIPVMIA